MLFSTYEKYVGQKYPPQKKNYFFVSFNNDRGLSLDDKTKDYVGGSTFVTWGHTTRVLFTVKICIFERSNEKINFSKTKVHFHKKKLHQNYYEILGCKIWKYGVKSNFGRLAKIFQIFSMDADILS